MLLHETGIVYLFQGPREDLEISGVKIFLLIKKLNSIMPYAPQNVPAQVLMRALICTLFN